MKKWFLPWDQLKIAHRLWTVRIALIGAVLDGAYVSIPVFQEYVTPIQFGVLCIGLSLSLVVARIVNQSGIDF
jgi:hypothetical protein